MMLSSCYKNIVLKCSANTYENTYSDIHTLKRKMKNYALTEGLKWNFLIGDNNNYLLMRQT